MIRTLCAVLFGRKVYCSRLHPHYTKAAADLCDQCIVDHERQLRLRKPGQAPPILLMVREI